MSPMKWHSTWSI